MIEASRLNELINIKSEIFVMFWFSLDSNLQIVRYKLNFHFKVKNNKLYYDDKCINDLSMCFENIDMKTFINPFKYQKCIIMFSEI